jgi:uncharacterized membrane protein
MRLGSSRHHRWPDEHAPGAQLADASDSLGAGIVRHRLKEILVDKALTAIHVAAAVFIIGPMAILPHTSLRPLRNGDAGQARSLAKSVKLFTLLSLITFVFGFAAMGSEPKKYDITFGDTWVWLSIVLYVIAFALSYWVVVPNMRKAADEAEAGAKGKPNSYGAIAGSAGATTLLLVVVVVLMVWRP